MKVLLFKKYNQQDFARNLLPEDFTAEGIKDFVKSGKFANALYNETKQINLRDIWRIVSNTIWDLTTFTTEEICPQCKNDNLRILTDLEKKTIYKACETCFGLNVMERQM